MIGIGAIKRRQIRALAKSSLWKVKGLDKVLDGMGQIPITRGSGDAGALDAAIAELRAGSCIGVFPEGTRSLGRTLRPRSGLGRLVAAVPEAVVVPVAVTGTTDITRFPERPRLHVRFLAPPEGMREGESPADYAARVVEEIRGIAPITIAGRKRRKLAALAPDRAEFSTARPGDELVCAPVPDPVLTPAIDKVASGRNLSQDEAAGVLEVIMAGDASEAQIAGLLIGAAHEGRDGRGDRRPGAHDARARRARHDGRATSSSTPPARAAGARRSTSRRPPR